MGKLKVNLSKADMKDLFLHWLDTLRESVVEDKLEPENFHWIVGINERLEGKKLIREPDGHETYEFNVFRPNKEAS